MEKLRILVAEDDMVVGMVLVDRLTKLGYDVIKLVSSGEEAVDYVGGTQPDLILMDIKLAGRMDGIEAATAIRAQHNIPIIYVSAYTDDPLLERAKKTDPFGYLVKPYGERDLRTAVEMALHKAEMERRLRESEARYRTLVENAPVGICSFDTEGRIIASNASFLAIINRIAGRDYADFNILTFAPFADSGFSGDVRACLESKARIVTERPYMCASGAGIHLKAILVPALTDEGELTGAQAILEDTTERKQSEELQLHAARYRAVADLAGGVAHNFNNLLQVISAGASLALLEYEDGDFSLFRESLERIIEASDSGTRIVKHLQGFAGTAFEPIAGGEKELLDLSEAVHRTVEIIEPWWKSNADKKGVKIDVKLDVGHGCKVYGFKDQLFQVVSNLIKNAVEALTEGGTVEIATRTDQERVILQVRDDGVGIPQEYMGRLFTPFFTTSPDVGRGLGLATSRKIVHGHGGEMTAESAVGRGTLVTVELPLATDTHRQNETSPRTLPGERLTLLVIDDAEAVAATLAAGLQKHGHTVLTALSSRTGLKILGENPVDVVICDSGMPEMNGWQVGKAIREFFRTQQGPGPSFILLTDCDHHLNNTWDTAECGVDAIVRRPVNIPELLEAIWGGLHARQSG